MTLATHTTRHTSHDIGKLCVGGDWACTHGDLGALRYVAQQLANVMPEPLHCELTLLATACATDPDRAVTLWAGLKKRVYRGAGM